LAPYEVAGNLHFHIREGSFSIENYTTIFVNYKSDQLKYIQKKPNHVISFAVIGDVPATMKFWTVSGLSYF
jgi:hypothetical protein